MNADRARAVVVTVLAAAVATETKTKAEQVLQPLCERLVPPAPAAKAGVGADAAGHPENMPPSELADRLQHAITGDELTDEQREKVSAPLHWSMGLGFGVGYGLLRRRVPMLRAGYGSVAGGALFVAAHGITLPAAGMQQPPARMPTAWWGWEAGSHLVYGVALEGALRVLDRFAP